MGRTEVHRKITRSEPWSSMQRSTANEDKTTPGSERRSLLKNCLTGPTLLEMSGYYVSHFSLTRWGNESQPTHILVPTKQTIRKGAAGMSF